MVLIRRSAVNAAALCTMMEQHLVRFARLRGVLIGKSAQLIETKRHLSRFSDGMHRAALQ
jgi:hypothetical protein